MGDITGDGFGEEAPRRVNAVFIGQYVRFSPLEGVLFLNRSKFSQRFIEKESKKVESAKRPEKDMNYGLFLPEEDRIGNVYFKGVKRIEPVTFSAAYLAFLSQSLEEQERENPGRHETALKVLDAINYRPRVNPQRFFLENTKGYLKDLEEGVYRGIVGAPGEEVSFRGQVAYKFGKPFAISRGPESMLDLLMHDCWNVTVFDVGSNEGTDYRHPGDVKRDLDELAKEPVHERY
jgi:hypothetical protein